MTILFLVISISFWFNHSKRKSSIDFTPHTQWSPLRQEPEAPQNNATSRGLHRIPPPAEAGGFQTAGLTCKVGKHFFLNSVMIKSRSAVISILNT